MDGRRRPPATAANVAGVPATDDYAQLCLPVLPAGPGVCRVCFGPSGGHPLCYPCHRCAAVLGPAAADAVVPVALAVKGLQLAQELWQYKNSASAGTRARLQGSLGGLLGRFLAEHEGCAAAAAGTAGFDVVTAVPSSAGRVGCHPLAALARGCGAGVAQRFRDCLACCGRDGPRAPRPDRFRAPQRLPSASVLLLEDTWTTGAHAQSASAALKAAGAARVAVVVVGRHVDAGFPGAVTYFLASRSRRFRFDRCCLGDSAGQRA